jgi:hypothetical protein
MAIIIPMITIRTSVATTMPMIFSTRAVFPDELGGELDAEEPEELPESAGDVAEGVPGGSGETAPPSEPGNGVDAGKVGFPPAAGLGGSSRPPPPVGGVEAGGMYDGGVPPPFGGMYEGGVPPPKFGVPVLKGMEGIAGGVGKPPIPPAPGPIPPPREQIGQNPGLFCVYPHRSHRHTVVIPLNPLIPVP